MKAFLLISTSALLLSAQIAHAQTVEQTAAVPNVESEQDSQSYEADYYSSFVPRTAYDMILRTPGFQIRLADERRGLGQGGANILLNGVRLSGKSTTPIEQIERIPASNVQRIEIIDGATSGIPGLTGRVANIVTQKSSFTGNWEWSPVFRNYVKPNWQRANISISGSKGNLEYGLTLTSNANRIASRGPERVTPANHQSASIDERFESAFSGPTVSANLKWAPTQNVISNLGVEFSEFNTNQRENASAPTGNLITLPEESIFQFGYDERSGEINGDLTWQIGRAEAKILGIYRYSDEFRRSSSTDISTSLLRSRSRFESQAESSEAILRGEFVIAGHENSSWQFAGEYDRNKLDFDTTLFTATNDMAFSPVILDAPATRVSEDRFETTVTHDRVINNKLNVQLSLGAEYSTLTQNGNSAETSRSFFRPKGFASATYTPRDNLSITAKIDRQVGQLNFLDFTSSVDLEDDLDQTGNPDLVPQQVWRADMSLNKSFEGGHVVDVTIFGEDISDLVDRIPIGATGDGVGNIPSATRYGIEASTTIKGESWGWNGFETQLAIEFADSEVVDPVEGFTRQLNNQTLRGFDVSFTYDPPGSPWGMGAELSQSIWSPIYRVRSIDENYRSPYGVAYIEHKDIFGLKVRASIYNSTDFSIELDRQIFDARRDQGGLLRTESRRRSFGPFLQFDISGQF